MGRMSVDLKVNFGLNDMMLFKLYQLATWVTFSALDDPAMLALAFG
jgi:hypothetical protein